MTKAISTVIASILMLMIVIALGGTTYLYISGTFTGKTSTAFEVIDAIDDTVTIRNTGTVPITSITSTLDGNSVNIAIVPNIQGLIAYWSFNEGSCPPSGTCTTDDNSDNNNIGTLNAGGSGSNVNPTDMWIDGRYGKALEFDGSNDYVDVGNPLPLNSNFNSLSLSFWVFANEQATRDAGLVGKGVSVYGTTFDRNRIFFYVGRGGGGNYIQMPITTGVYHHVSAVFDGTNKKLYLDGNPTPPVASVDSSTGTGGEFRIGGTFSGTIDEVMIFNRALSENEIKQLYSGLVSPGQLATIKPLASLSKGTHTLRLCITGMCNTAILTII